MRYGVVCLFLIVVIGFTYIEARDCQDGQTKTVDCNRCSCANGQWICTLKACLRKRAIPECQPGETKQEDCNTCTCANGVFACTRKLCLSKREAIAAKFNSQLSRPKRGSCVPGTSFKDDCNTCFCGPTGVPACTLKLCLKKN